jgi:putative sterol carrier protein
MATSTDAFFDRLAQGQSVAVLGSARGSIRFDLRDGRKVEHWRVELGRDGTTVSRSDAPADCVVQLEHTVFDDLTAGRQSPMPALLKGLVGIEGDPELLVRFQRVFPVVERRPEAASSRTVGKRRG